MPSSTDRSAVVVTGAGSGIGFSIALRLARGYRVLAVDVRSEGLDRLVEAAREHDLQVDTRVADAADEREMADLFLQVDRSSEPLHGAVLCAGVTRRSSLLDTTVDELSVLGHINVASAFLGIREAGRTLRRQGRGGSVVAVTSINALRALPSQAAYSATKAAVTSLVVSAALELGPFGVRVNAVAPGAVLTPMNPGLGPDDPLRERIPLRRIGTPGDLDGVAEFLLGDDASYITGSSLVVDGGFMHVR